MTDPEYIDTVEAAKRLGVSPRRVRQLIDEKRLPATKVGRSYIIDPADVDAFERGALRARRLTEDEVREIKHRLAGGESQSQIARDYDVTRSAIAAIDQGRAWVHVTISD